jgi:hypothetical protein
MLLPRCIIMDTIIFISKSKSKAVPLEEVQLLLIHDLGTRWGEWSESRLGRALPPGKGPPVPIVQEAGRAPEPVWTQRLEEKSYVRFQVLTASMMFRVVFWVILPCKMIVDRRFRGTHL